MVLITLKNLKQFWEKTDLSSEEQSILFNKFKNNFSQSLNYVTMKKCKRPHANRFGISNQNINRLRFI